MVCGALLASVFGGPLATVAADRTYTIAQRDDTSPPAEPARTLTATSQPDNGKMYPVKKSKTTTPPQENREQPPQTPSLAPQSVQPTEPPRTSPPAEPAPPPTATPQPVVPVPTATPQEVRPATAQGAAPVAPANVAERVLRSKYGSKGFRELLGQIEKSKGQSTRGQGAPSADTWFDNALPRTGVDTARPQGTPVFQGAPSTASQPTTRTPQQAIDDYRNSGEPAGPRTLKITPPPPPTITNTSRPATAQDAQEIRKNYKSIPGGIVLEGVAMGLGEVRRVQYDPRFNAFLLDDRAVYFMKVPRRSVAVLCEAIAADDKVGVSLGRIHLVYGAVPPDSDVAMDLKLADHFLGDIVFARKDWTAGYRYANGFEPQANEDGIYSVAVFFNFNGFEFRIDQEEVGLSRVNLDVRLVPLSEGKSAEGGHLPDFDAISKGRVSRQYERNARHVAESIGYYRQERIIDRTFAYGEVAAFIRGLKEAGVDLRGLARSVLAEPAPAK